MNLEECEKLIRKTRHAIDKEVEEAGLSPVSSAHLHLALSLLMQAEHNLDLAALHQAQALAGAR